MSDEKIIKNNSENDLEAMEAFDMALGINPGNDCWVCGVCGYIYDPETGDPANGIAPGTRFDDLPASWVCPVCRAPKSAFAPKMEVNPEEGESWTNS